MKINPSSPRSQEFPQDLKKEAHILSEKAANFLVDSGRMFAHALNKQRKVTTLFSTAPTEKTETAAKRAFKRIKAA